MKGQERTKLSPPAPRRPWYITTQLRASCGSGSSVHSRNVHASQVRNGLGGGGRWIRTLGPRARRRLAGTYPQPSLSGAAALAATILPRLLAEAGGINRARRNLSLPRPAASSRASSAGAPAKGKRHVGAMALSDFTFRSVAVEETTLFYWLNRYARGRVPARAGGVRRLPQDYEKGQLTSNVLDLIVNFTRN